MLKQVTGIEIKTSDIAQGALYLAWLADRLNLSPESTIMDRATSTYKISMTGDRDVEASIVLLEPAQCRSIKNVRLSFANSPDHDLTIEAESRVIKASYKDTIEYLELPIDDPRESAIDQILTSKKTDPFYLRALGIMAAFNQTKPNLKGKNK